jgi:hypothetical protein
MAAAVIIATVGSLSSLLMINAIDNYLEASAASQIHTELSVSLDRIVRELRNIPLDPDEPGNSPNITLTSASSIQWEDDDGDQYDVLLSGTDLQLRVNGGALITLTEDVKTFVVQAFDRDDTLLAADCAGDTCKPIRRVAVSVTVRRQYVIDTIDATIFIRSTMSGGA